MPASANLGTLSSCIGSKLVGLNRNVSIEEAWQATCDQFAQLDWNNPKVADELGKAFFRLFAAWKQSVPSRLSSLQEKDAAVEVLYRTGRTASTLRKLLSFGRVSDSFHCNRSGQFKPRHIDRQRDIYSTTGIMRIADVANETHEALRRLGIPTQCWQHQAYHAYLKNPTVRAYGLTLTNSRDPQFVSLYAGRLATARKYSDNQPPHEVIGGATVLRRADQSFVIERLGLAKSAMRESTVTLAIELLEKEGERGLNIDLTA